MKKSSILIFHNENRQFQKWKMRLQQAFFLELCDSLNYGQMQHLF